MRILETDAPTYYLVLNVYVSSGGLVSGARAEWSVFVKDPVDGQPRFLVVQAAAAATSADSVRLLTQPEPVTHIQTGDAIVSYVGVEVGDPSVEETYWRSSIVWPQVDETRVGTAREFVAANDSIYWGNGVGDRALYNGTVHNRDAVLIPETDIQITDNSRWKSYVHPSPKHSYVYLNPLEIAVSPWWNLGAEYLDLSTEHRQALITFKDAFYPAAVQKQAADAIREGTEVLTAFAVSNATPTAYFNFRVRDVDGLASMLALPDGHALTATTILSDEVTPEHYLTLRVYQRDDALEGLRAEWCVYTDDGAGRAHRMIVASVTADVAVDPVTLVGLPGLVEHALVHGELHTRLATASLRLDATLSLQDAVSALPSLDWVETGDYVCWLNGVCDKLYYDGATLTAPVARIPSPLVEDLVTPWSGLLDPEPVSVFVRETPQVFAEEAWQNVR